MNIQTGSAFMGVTNSLLALCGGLPFFSRIHQIVKPAKSILQLLFAVAILLTANQTFAETREMEAEAATSYVSANGSGDDDWTIVADGTASGNFAIRSLDNNGTFFDDPGCCDGAGAEAALANYVFNLSTPDAYYVYVLARAGDDDASTFNNDSFHIGFNGSHNAEINNIDVTYEWASSGAQALLAGNNTVNVWEREDGVWIDRVIISTQSNIADALTELAATPTAGTVQKDNDANNDSTYSDDETMLGLSNTVTFQLTIDNPSGSGGTLTIDTITDDIYGDILALGAASTCDELAAGTIAEGASVTCTFDALVTLSDADDIETNTITMESTIGGDATTDADTSVVRGINLVSIQKDNNADNAGGFSDDETMASLSETVQFQLTLGNNGASAATITALTDNIFGDLSLAPGANPLLSANTCDDLISAPTVIASGGADVTCTFSGTVTLDDFADTEKNTATLTAMISGLTITDSDASIVRGRGGRGPEPVQTFYIPYPENELLASLTDINAAAVTPLTTLIGIAILQSNTIIYVDHWEDNAGASNASIANGITGTYEADIADVPNYNDPFNNGTNIGTEVWGDDDLSNGSPNNCTVAGCDILSRGDVVILNGSNVAVPLNQAEIEYNAHDKFAASRLVSITRAGWANTPGTVMAGAWEVYDTSVWGQEYELPIGEDVPALNLGTEGNEEFEHVSASIMATIDGTVVEIDTDANGSIDITETLDEGDSYHVDGGLQLGATISTSEDVQVHLIGGNDSSSYESRSFTLFPTERWADAYVTSVDSASANELTSVWLYNPNDSSITVNVTLNGAVGTPVVVTANSIGQYSMPVGFDDGNVNTYDNAGTDSGAYFSTADGSIFYALSTYDNDVGHDWGHTLVPESSLSQQALVSLGDGLDPNSGDDRNGSPIWITPWRLNGDTTGKVDVCIDFTPDGGAGIGVDNYTGLPYDLKLNLNVLQRYKAYDTIENDNDQSGALVYICDVVVDANPDSAQNRNFAVVSAAWGEDIREITNQNPGFDAGTGIPNVRSFIVTKRSAFSNDITGDGEADIGDEITYTISIANTGFVPIATLNIEDSLPIELAYIHGSTTITNEDDDNYATPTAIADNVAPDTIFPLDDGGLSLTSLMPATILNPDQELVLSYSVRVVATPFSAEDLCNTAVGSISNDSDDGQDCLPDNTDGTFGSINGTVWLDVDGDGVEDVAEPGVVDVTVYLCPFIDEMGPPVIQQIECDASFAIATTVTDANGDYSFDGLDAGSYQTAVEQTEKDMGNELEDLSESPGNIASLSGEIIVPDGGVGEADFGYIPQQSGGVDTAVVEGTIWADYDEDGIQDPGEIGIPNVSVNLVDSTGAIIATVVSQEDGSYIFTDIQFTGSEIQDGREFTVQVVTTDADLVAYCGALTVNDFTANDCATNNPISNSVASTPFTALPGDIVADIDFGFDPDPAVNGATNVFSDRIWYDNDADGVQDGDEEGIEGVTVNLLDSSGSVIATAVTDANGDFIFAGLSDSGAADYTVEITDNAGLLNSLTETTSTGGDQDITDISGDLDNTNPGNNGNAPRLTGSGTGSPSFGFNQPLSIGGTVYSDGNDSGDLEATDSGLGGLDVELQHAGCTPGADCPVVQTNPDGSYLFTDLTAGVTYTVVVNPDGGNNGQAPFGTPYEDPDQPTLGTGDSETTVTLTAGQSASGVDFGYVDSGDALPNISGTVFHDVDTDGSHEPDGNDGVAANGDDEDGIAGVTVELRDNSGNVVATTTTDNNGDYTFEDVPIVDLDTNTTDYVVTVTDIGNILDGYELTSGLDQLAVDSSSGDVADVDFGYANDEQVSAILSGVWVDSNRDGIRDPDETPIANVDVDLIDCGLDAICGTGDDVVIATTSTDANGNVIFPDLPPGTYLLDVDESDPDLPGDYDETTYPGSVNNPNIPILLSEGEEYKADFGFFPDAAESAVTGILWSDADADGSIDSSESRVEGITVTLYNLSGGLLTANSTTMTAVDGSYEFTGLPACNPVGTPCYVITYDIPAVNTLGLNGNEPTNTPDQNDADPTTPSGPDGINDTNYVFTLAAGEVGEDYNFGFDSPLPLAELQGYVYFEPLNGTPNGAFDGPDTGIKQVTLNLLDSSGNVIATTITGDGTYDANGDGFINANDIGFYEFTGITDGNYTIAIVDGNNALIGFNPSGDPDETGLCTSCDGNFSFNVSGTTITDSSNDPVTGNVNFGYLGEQPLGNLGDLIWLDIDGDGLFEPELGDAGLEGVTVECWVDTNNDGDFGVAGANDFTPDGIDNLVRTVTTDENGLYYCEGLPAGNYFVRVTDTADVIDASFSAATVVGGTLNDTNKTDITIPHAYYVVKSSDAADVLFADFAVRGTANLEISGTVFIEPASLVEPDSDSLIETGELDGVPNTSSNGPNGVQDLPASDVTVVLYRLSNGVYEEFLTTTTNGNGDYSFDGLPAGDYQVLVDPTGSGIEGYGQTADPDLAANAFPDNVCDSDTAAACDNKTTITLSATSVTGVDFGYQNGFTTTPVSVNYFIAQGSGGSVKFTWDTSNEVGLAGYQLYARGDISWALLNAELILPLAGDAMTSKTYTYQASVTDEQWFALVDVDVSEKLTIHGPYQINKEYGEVLIEPEAFDWSGIAKVSRAQLLSAKRRAQAQAQEQLTGDRVDDNVDVGGLYDEEDPDTHSESAARQ